MRRWYLVLAVLGLTVGLCFVAASKIGPTYEVNASVVLIPPKSTDDPTANRYLSLSGLSQAVDVLSRSLNADRTHEVVGKVAPVGSFDVAGDDTTSAPILTITAKASSTPAANQLVDAVLKQVPVNLSKLQSSLSISRKAEITSIVLTRDDKPTVIQKKRMRAIVGLMILFLGGGVFLIAAADGLLLRRSRPGSGTRSNKTDPRGTRAYGGLRDPQIDPGQLPDVDPILEDPWQEALVRVERSRSTAEEGLLPRGRE